MFARIKTLLTTQHDHMIEDALGVTVLFTLLFVGLAVTGTA